MISSVWNQGKGKYDYFEDGSKQASLNAPAPSHLRERTLGSTVDQAAWPLPSASRYVGSGDAAVGRVCARGASPLGAIDTASPTTKAVLLIGAGLLAWKLLLKKGR